MSLFGSILRSVDSGIDDVAEAALKGMREPGRFVPSPRGYVPKKGDWNLPTMSRAASDLTDVHTDMGNTWNNIRDGVTSEQYAELLDQFGVSTRSAIPQDLLPDFDQQWSMAESSGFLDDLTDQRFEDYKDDVEAIYRERMGAVRKRISELPSKHPFRKYINHLDANWEEEYMADSFAVNAFLDQLTALAEEGVDRRDITQVFSALTKNGTQNFDPDTYGMVAPVLGRIPEKDRLTALTHFSDHEDSILDYVSNIIADRPELKGSVPGLLREAYANIMDIYNTLPAARREEYLKELANWHDDLDSLAFMLENA